jgi:hypothetical protein
LSYQEQHNTSPAFVNTFFGIWKNLFFSSGTAAALLTAPQIISVSLQSPDSGINPN